MLKVNVKKLPKSEVEIEGEIPADIFETYFSKALKRLGQRAKIDGFREGKIPENVLLKHIPEAEILEAMAELALNEHYPKILEAEKIDAISQPEVSITKLARHNPLGFKIKAATMPNLTIPDYKAIAKKIILESTDKKVEVTEEDVESTILDIRKSRAPKKHITEAPNLEENSEKSSKESSKEVEADLPELNDEFVKALGPFENVADFKTKLRENLKLEKENQKKEKARLKIAEEILEGTTAEIPDILTELEVNKIVYRMESDIAQMGLKFEDYLKHINKKVEDLRSEFRGEAEKKAKLSLVLNEIARIEKIEADQTQVEKEVAMILEHYKDADPERARMHAENVLTNEKIFQFLESQ